jgi:stage V sporulation protein R
MEGCKERARSAGLKFDNETLEYVVTNRDLIELTPKFMIPTLYDYWVHDVEVLREKGRYELYPSNPYETVINTRPAISFYNDNNPDWLNVMIFYHVLGHIDFFQNNSFYQNTWHYDFAGQALSDKRMIAKMRSERGRWVDYVIEFSRGIDNLVGYHSELSRLDHHTSAGTSRMVDYYFDVFLQSVLRTSVQEFVKELDRYNWCVREYGKEADQKFFAQVNSQHPEFGSLFEKHNKRENPGQQDVLQFLMNNSPFLKKQENTWMKTVMEIVRNTSLFFQPQIRTKIMNEGWASYWHEKLFILDERITGHEVEFARTHANVTAIPRVGLNPYALGMRLFQHIEELGDKGKYSRAYRSTANANTRRKFDAKAGKGNELIFEIRRNFCDQLFVDTFLDQDFVDRNKLFVSGKRLNHNRMTWEYYVKSRSAQEYRKMMHDHLYHPPSIEAEVVDEGALRLKHAFEGKPLVSEFIANTLLGIEYLWGAPVELETNEANVDSYGGESSEDPDQEPEIQWTPVRYTMRNRTLSKQEL